MSDLFHEDVPDDFINSVVTVMERANWHTYQVLTKRSERLSCLLRTKLQRAAKAPHIWWGVSVENRRVGLPRVRDLQEASACVRFLSIEPLLEDLGPIDLSGISWVIVGGESGRGARPLRRDWVVSIQRQCQASDVPFFFKQWGGVQKSKAGRELLGRTFDEFPPIVRSAVPDKVERDGLLQQMSRAINTATRNQQFLLAGPARSNC